MTQTHPNFFGTIKVPAIISSIVVLPFILLESINGRNSYGMFPFALFAVMWLLLLSFLALMTTMLRSASTAHPQTSNPIRLWSGFVLLILIGWLWVVIVMDQMPCFLGVPNCD